jgi:hypothetical protein
VTERKGMLLRLDPAVHDALARWAADDLRSTNAQIEFLLRRALADAGRLPGHAGRMRGRGRPRAGRREGQAGAEEQSGTEDEADAVGRPDLESASSLEGAGGRNE